MPRQTHVLVQQNVAVMWRHRLAIFRIGIRQCARAQGTASANEERITRDVTAAALSQDQEVVGAGLV